VLEHGPGSIVASIKPRNVLKLSEHTTASDESEGEAAWAVLYIASFYWICTPTILNCLEEVNSLRIQNL
jgi:hypothetical protein